MKKMIEICEGTKPRILNAGNLVPLSKTSPKYTGKGTYQIEGHPGKWYIRAARFGWGYIATPAPKK